jgi:hypothetical protein
LSGRKRAAFTLLIFSSIDVLRENNASPFCMFYKSAGASQPRGVSKRKKKGKKPAEVAVRVACAHAARHRARGMRAALGFLKKKKKDKKREKKMQ